MRDSYWSRCSPMQKPMTNMEISDLWYNVARLQEKYGDKADAKESRRVARYFRGSKK